MARPDPRTYKGSSPDAGTRKGTRILVVDDHPMVRHGLIDMLQSEPDLIVCGEAADSSGTLELVERETPDLILMDISLADCSGIELIKQIKARRDSVRVLVLSMHDEALFAERALRAGAMGYLSKSEPRDTVIAAVRQVSSGKIYLSERMTNRMLTRQVRGGQEVLQPSLSDLSDREIEVFECIGRGMSTREIADQLNLSVKTIETHRENIKRKLGLERNIQLVQQAFQWVLEQK